MTFKGSSINGLNIDEMNEVLGEVVGKANDIQKRLRDPELVEMPKELTAENGAKGLMSGEFFEIKTMDCPHCQNDICEDEACEECEDTGECHYRVDITWDTIKRIYRTAVKHLGKK